MSRLSDEYYDYRSDEEMFPDEQSCDNCFHARNGSCPIDLAEGKAAQKMEREDAIRHHGMREWCIYWEQDRRENGW